MHRGAQKQEFDHQAKADILFGGGDYQSLFNGLKCQHPEQSPFHTFTLKFSDKRSNQRQHFYILHDLPNCRGIDAHRKSNVVVSQGTQPLLHRCTLRLTLLVPPFLFCSLFVTDQCHDLHSDCVLSKSIGENVMVGLAGG